MTDIKVGQIWRRRKTARYFAIDSDGVAIRIREVRFSRPQWFFENKPYRTVAMERFARVYELVKDLPTAIAERPDVQYDNRYWSKFDRRRK